MLFSLFLSNKAIFLCLLFFLLSIVFKNTRLILALAIPTVVPVTTVNERREAPLPVFDKASRVFSDVP